MSRFSLLVFLLLLIVAFGILLPGTFATRTNFVSILRSDSYLLILTLAEAFIMRTGEIDASVSAVMVLSATIIGLLTGTHTGNAPLVLVITVAILAGAAAGAVNAFVTVKCHVRSLIGTLGTLTALGAAAVGLTGGATLENLPSALLAFSNHPVLGLPVSVLYGWALAGVVWVIFEYTPFGRYQLFIAHSEEGARLAGVPVMRVRVISFVVAGALSAFAGVILAGSVGAVDPTQGSSYLLPPLAAVFVGTATVQLGRVNVLGTLIGLYLLGVGESGILLEGGADWVSSLFQGAILIVAVAIAMAIARRRSD
jgi:ribose transport system permease protein